jgi:hypothetical protein
MKWNKPEVYARFGRSPIGDPDASPTEDIFLRRCDSFGKRATAGARPVSFAEYVRITMSPIAIKAATATAATFIVPRCPAAVAGGRVRYLLAKC